MFAGISVREYDESVIVVLKAGSTVWVNGIPARLTKPVKALMHPGNVAPAFGPKEAA